MNKLKIMTYFTALMIALFLLCEVCITFFYPQYDSVARYILPAFYWLMYSAFILAVKLPLEGTAAPKYIMAFKSAKLFLSLTLLALLAFSLRDQATGVIINFLVYSMVLLVVETAAVLYIKKHLV